MQLIWSTTPYLTTNHTQPSINLLISSIFLFHLATTYYLGMVYWMNSCDVPLLPQDKSHRRLNTPYCDASLLDVGHK